VTISDVSEFNTCLQNYSPMTTCIQSICHY